LFPAFEPYFRNPHLATIAANFWKRNLTHPSTATLFETEPGVRVMAMTTAPAQPRGTLVALHGLEGSHDSGYLQSLAQAAVALGLTVHRLNMRGCGGTEGLSKTLYHAGLTADLHAILPQLAPPVFLAGFSLGGNVMLKLLGELGTGARRSVKAAAVCSVPLDLHACCLQMMQPRNRIYERRFVRSLKNRFRRRAAEYPDLYQTGGLDEIQTVIAFDDRITAPYFGFGNAERYYATQSAQRFLDPIAVPTLLIQAEDDPLIPLEVYRRHAAFQSNPYLRLLAVPHGGHVGFIARRPPRFWVDEVISRFFREHLA
jgi:uncharacterized protein